MGNIAGARAGVRRILTTEAACAVETRLAASPSAPRRAAGRRQSPVSTEDLSLAGKFTCSAENRLEHFFCQLAGLGILIGGMVGRQ